MAKIGLLTGSFDPVTKGHEAIIRRASRLFDQLYIGIFYNDQKSGYFSVDQRQSMLEEVFQDLANVTVIQSKDRLAVEVARELGVTSLVRGLRGPEDLDYEARIHFFNNQLAPEIETVFLLTQPELKYVSSSHIRELIHFGADLTPYLSAPVIKEVEKKQEHDQT